MTVLTAADWIALGLGAWPPTSVVVGLVLGGVVRNRDRQIPHD